MSINGKLKFSGLRTKLERQGRDGLVMHRGIVDISNMEFNMDFPGRWKIRTIHACSQEKHT